MSTALCQCGCGQPTSVETRNRSDRGRIKGQPARFINGHNSRGKAYCLKHGHKRLAGASTEYRIWHGMIQRCTNPKRNSWRYYGARGISVCERWLNFVKFLADMGPRPAGKTLDRINNDGDYEPSNCRWAPPKEQRANRRDSAKAVAA